MKKNSLSIAIITNNEEENLSKLLSVINKISNDIVIVDSGSIDNTPKIAAEYNCNFITQSWLGFSKQKNIAFDNCKNDWILFLDADEIPDEQLIISINKVLYKNEPNSFILKRYSYYLDKLMNYSWQPDRQLRLVHKSLEPLWEGGDVHEYLNVGGNKVIIEGKLIHYSYKSISHHFEKTIKYAELGAKKMISNNRKFGYYNLVLNPIIAFVAMYFIKCGFMDGWRGIIAAFSSMTGTFLKYSIAISLKKNKNH